MDGIWRGSANKFISERLCLLLPPKQHPPTHTHTGLFSLPNPKGVALAQRDCVTMASSHFISSSPSHTIHTHTHTHRQAQQKARHFLLSCPTSPPPHHHTTTTTTSATSTTTLPSPPLLHFCAFFLLLVACVPPSHPQTFNSPSQAPSHSHPFTRNYTQM